MQASSEWIPKYLESLEAKQLAQPTIKTRRRQLLAIESSIGIELHNASESQIELAIHSIGENMKPGTIRLLHSNCRVFFQYLLRRKVIESDPTVNLEAPKLEERLPVALSRRQVSDMLGVLGGWSARQRRDAAIVATLYYTGIRRAELQQLDWEDVDLVELQLRVFGKGRRERLVPFPSDLVRWLEAYREVHPTREGAVFVTTDYRGQRITDKMVEAAVKRVLKTAGVTGLRVGPHKLRHTYATRLLAEGVPLTTISKALGHRQLGTTTIYAETVIDQEVKTAIDRYL